MMRLSMILTMLMLCVTLHAKKSNTPERVARVIEPCEELALNETTHLRAVGTAKSSVEKIARSEALRDARTQLANRIHIAVESVASDYNKSETESSRDTESVTTQYVTQYIDKSRPIKWSIYDLADGRVEVFVCVEMLQSEDESLQKLIDNLNYDDLISSKEERDKAINTLRKSLEEYRKQLLEPQ